MTDTEYDKDDDEYVSKSQLKREMLALQALGTELVDLSQDALARFGLPEKLLEAINAARSIHQRGARKRQLQYIGRLMRDVDPDPIREQLDAIKGQSRQATARLHKIEQWRERMISEGDSAVNAFVEAYPHADRQQLRQLVRSAQKETLENKPPKAFRSLFKNIRDAIQS